MSKYAAQKWRELGLRYERRSNSLLLNRQSLTGSSFVLSLCETSSEPWNSSLHLLRPPEEIKCVDSAYWWETFSGNKESWDERATACALLAAIEEDEE